MPALGIVPNGVIGTHADPVRNRAILPKLLRQLFLNPESLLGRLKATNRNFDIKTMPADRDRRTALKDSDIKNPKVLFPYGSGHRL